MKTFVFLIFIGFFFYIPQVFAVSVAITQYPSVLTLDPFTISASISGATNGTNYLRIDIYKDGTQSYFGTTFNGTDWYGDSNYQLYLPITIASNKWSGVINGSIGSPNVSQYDGTGIYKISLRRYTSGGTYTASEAEANSVVVTIVTPSPTPTPTDTPTNTPYPTPISAPTNTPVPTPTKSATPSPTKSPSLTKSISPTILLADSFSSSSSTTGNVLGENISVRPTLISGENSQDQKIDWFPIITSGSGMLILVSCGILFYRNYQKNKTNE